MGSVPDWLMPLRTSAARATPLFLIHPVGGSAMAYLPLADALDDRACLGVEARGLHHDEMDQTLVSAADVYAEVVRKLRPTGPYALAGWSMGATIAFEIARRLRATGERIALLALLDPEPGWTVRSPDEHSLVAGFVRDMLRQTRGPGEVDALVADVMAGVTGPDVAAAAVERLKRSELIPPGSEDIVGRRIEVFRTLSRAHAGYRPTPADVAVTLFSGREGAERQRVAWQPLGRGGFRQYVLAADHYSLLGPTHVDRIAAVITETLAAADRTYP